MRELNEQPKRDNRELPALECGLKLSRAARREARHAAQPPHHPQQRENKESRQVIEQHPQSREVASKPGRSISFATTPGMFSQAGAYLHYVDLFISPIVHGPPLVQDLLSQLQSRQQQLDPAAPLSHSAQPRAGIDNATPMQQSHLL